MSFLLSCFLLKSLLNTSKISIVYEFQGCSILISMMQARIVDLAEMRRELQWKESKIAELTTVVQSKERVIADLENYKVSYSTLADLTVPKVSPSV